MGNTQSDDQNNINKSSNVITPPKPNTQLPNSNFYPKLDDNSDHDYEILNPPGMPTRPAPKPPTVQHQHSTHTLSNYNGLEGVPFVINPKFLNASSKEKVCYQMK